jgi:hypothetical protein
MGTAAGASAGAMTASLLHFVQEFGAGLREFLAAHLPQAAREFVFYSLVSAHISPLLRFKDCTDGLFRQ